MRYAIYFLTICSFNFCYGQEHTEKKFDHYAAVQINQLVKEVINLNTNNALIENPYLLQYTLMNIRYNTGLRIGAGYDYDESKDLENPDARTNKINDLSLKAGICKRYAISNKFEIEYGLDYIYRYKETKTYSNTVVSFGIQSDSSSFQTKNVIKTNGGGIGIALRFYVSPRVLIGTETSIHYLKSEEKEHSLTFTSSTGGSQPVNNIEVQNQGTTGKAVQFNLPIAIFFVIKF